MIGGTDWLDLLRRQWLVGGAAAGMLLTSLVAGRLPSWTPDEFQVLFLLVCLLVAVEGLRRSGLVEKTARAVERGGAVPVKLVTATFLLSMLVTNDVALVVVVPLTFSLTVGRKGLLVVLEALAANAGSSLAPSGNPQNLYIYWRYGIPLGDFVRTIAPFSLVFLVLLVVAALAVRPRDEGRTPPPVSPVPLHAGAAAVHGVLLLVVLLAVLRVLPLPAGGVVLIHALVRERKALRVDYALLLTFLFLFGTADNLRVLLAAEIHQTAHVFLMSVLASQVMSNVPATLLLAEFTPHWQALLWGVSAGGFGGLFGSLANLIAYRLYLSHAGTRHAARFTALFLALGFAALLAAAGLYLALYSGGIS